MTELYRKGKLGKSLEASLDEMVESGKIPGPLAFKVADQFDEAMARAMETKVSAKANFKSKLQVYRYIDNVWTFVMVNTTLRVGPFLTSPKKDEVELLVEGPLKMVLVDSKLLPGRAPEEGAAKGAAAGKK